MVSFKLLETFLNDVNINMTITKNENGLTVSILPQPKCKDEAKKGIVPILLKGTAEELDKEFHVLIQKPFEKISGITANITSFEESADKLAKESKAAEALKEQAKKDKEKAEKLVVKAKEYLEKKEYDKAMFQVNEALKLSDKLASAVHLKDEIDAEKKKNSQVDIFSVIEEEKKPTIKEVVEASPNIEIVKPASTEYLQENPKTIEESFKVEEKDEMEGSVEYEPQTPADKIKPMSPDLSFDEPNSLPEIKASGFTSVEEEAMMMQEFEEQECARREYEFQQRNQETINFG